MSLEASSGEPIAAPAASPLSARVASVAHWYHRIALTPELETPGSHDSPAALAALDAVGFPPDLTGRWVLDVGTRDGFFAFAAERRGAAEVVAVDYVPAEETGFAVAAESFRSRVRYVQGNLYDLDPGRLGTFDVVLLLGVLYHLRNPLRALDAVRALQRPGGRLFVETQLATDPPTLASGTALWQFFRGSSLAGDGTSRWAPNMAGLHAAVEEAEYRVTGAHADSARGLVAAEAVVDRRRAYFRALDSASVAPSRPNRSAPEATPEERPESTASPSPGPHDPDPSRGASPA